MLADWRTLRSVQRYSIHLRILSGCSTCAEPPTTYILRRHKIRGCVWRIANDCNARRRLMTSPTSPIADTAPMTDLLSPAVIYARGREAFLLIPISHCVLGLSMKVERRVVLRIGGYSGRWSRKNAVKSQLLESPKSPCTLYGANRLRENSTAIGFAGKAGLPIRLPQMHSLRY